MVCKQDVLAGCSPPKARQWPGLSEILIEMDNFHWVSLIV